MEHESARPPDAPETPLSVTFRDSAFMNFVNDIRDSNDTSLHHGTTLRHAQQGPESNTSRPGARPSTNEEGSRPPRKAYETPPRQLKNALHDDTPGSSDRPHSGPSASLAPSNNNNNQASLGTNADDDADWDDLNNIELTSQVMRQLMETEESFYSTQGQCLDSASMMLSQEFAEARIGDS
ncbi:hypothetical protein GGI24_002546, partial [Coemansia furcata]